MRPSRGRFHPAPFLLLILISISACGDPPVPAANAQQQSVIWNTVGTWTGRGDQQLDSFTSDTGALRIEWEAKAEKDAEASGTFRLAIHSAISGRPLTVPVDHPGAGSGTVFVSEEPRVFFAVVTGEGMEWSFTVSERLR